MVTLHGAGNDALFAWVGLFKRLLESDTEIFTFDLPGHGRATSTRFDPGLASRAVRIALARCAVHRAGVPIHAVGVSLGGSVLIHTLPEVQRDLASASVIVAPLRIELTPRSLLGEIGPRTLALLWREREHYGLSGLIPSFGPFKRDIYPLRLAGNTPPGAFGYVEALNRMLASMQLEAAAGRVQLPVLLAYGDRDRIVPRAQGQRLARMMPSAELFEVPGGTHLSTPLEHQTTDRLLRWIEQHE